MKQNKKSLSAGRQGFTLVEILIIICIIGILVSAIMVSLMNAKNRSQDVSAFTSFKSVASPAFLCLISGLANVRLTDPVFNSNICSNSSPTPDSVWPDLSAKLGWSSIQWCDLDSNPPTTAKCGGGYSNGLCGGDRATGNFCIFATKGSGASQETMWCSVTGCHKIGF